MTSRYPRHGIEREFYAVRAVMTQSEWHLLVHDDTDGVVQDALAKDDAVQLRVNLVCVEDGQDRHRVCGRQCRAKNEALKQCELEAFET